MNQRKLDIMQIQAQEWARLLYEKHLINMQGERVNYAESRTEISRTSKTAEGATEETATQEEGWATTPGAEAET